MHIKATVIVPTTGNRGELLKYAVGSVQNQSIQDIEIFIIGDGVADASKQIIQEMQQQDTRIHFFDFPKGERRGENYRHEVIMNYAKGDIICYLCDRDLMLPNYIETLYQHFPEFNFIVGNTLFLKENQDIIYWKIPFYGKNVEKIRQVRQEPAFNLSSVAHSLDFYKQLPKGWQTTPKNERFTDQYMWKQFLNHPACKAITLTKATNLWIKRGHHPGWSMEKRLPELKKHYEMISNPIQLEEITETALGNLIKELNDYKTKSLIIRINGYKLSEVPRKLKERIASYFKKV